MFSFTRAPSIKISIGVEQGAAVGADNDLVLIGRLAATGSSVVANSITVIENFGDEVLAKTESEGYFGADSEIVEMVVAAIKGNKFSNAVPKVFPRIKVLALANASTDLASALAVNATVPMPYVAAWFPTSEETLRQELRDHLDFISSASRGRNGQFGSIGFIATDGSLATASENALALGSRLIAAPYLRDTAVTKANKVHEVSAAFAAVNAVNPAPFNPMNDIVVGGLKVPVSLADHHTTGDTGTTALSLSAGLTPLEINSRGQVVISRAITTIRTNDAFEDISYFDIADMQTIFFFRKTEFAIAAQEKYKRTKASAEVAKNIMSEIKSAAIDFQDEGMFQQVEKFFAQFTVERSRTNRSAFVYKIPYNVVPGLHNIGIENTATTQFDEIEL